MYYENLASSGSKKSEFSEVLRNNQNTEFLKHVGGIELKSANKNLIAEMILQKQDYRALQKFKNSLFEKDNSEKIEFDTYQEILKKNKSTFVSEKIENMFLDAVLESGYIIKNKLIEVLDCY